MSAPEETMNVIFTVPVIARMNLGSTADISHIFYGTRKPWASY